MIDHFGLSAPFYDRLLGRPDTMRLCRLLRLPSAGRMLDAGGGTGRVAAHLRRKVDQLIISDVSRPMLRQALKKRLTPVAAKAEGLPFADGCFDRILVVDALHHFEDQEQALHELGRLLRPGGRLVIEEPDIRRLAVRLVALAEKLFLMQSHFHSPAEIRDMMRSGGLVARIAERDLFRTWITGDKPL